MISTTAHHKVRNPRETENSEAPDRDELGQENTADDKVRGYVGSYDASSSFGGPPRDGRFRTRGRITEFRHSRGGGRGGRGRGGFPPRGERDENTYKYHESLAQTNSDAWSHGGTNKFYERSDLVVNLPEDPRISKLLRRLCAEVDVEKSLVICNKLQEAVMLPENARYIRRSYDILVESLLDVLYDAPGPETKEGAAVVLGRIGHVMGHEFRKHLDWIATTYSVQNSSIKHLLTLSFSETFQLDLQTPNLSEFAELTLEKLQSIIEGTDSADVFIAAINAMIILSNSYPEHFANHFVDTVDILVGWHVDNAQPKKIKEFALQSLFKLSRHWQADVGFSVNLLNQFVEDMVCYASDLDPNKKDKDAETNSHEDCLQKIASFLNVFNIVVKSLGNLLSPNVSQTVSWSFLTDALSKILQVLIETLKQDADSDLLLAGNECIILLLKYLHGKSFSCSVSLFTLISMEMTNYLQIDESLCLSIINLISSTVKEIASNLPIDFINQTIGPESLLRPLRYSESQQIICSVMTIYSNLLNLKNIPLLQETYKFVLSDMQNACAVIIPDIQIIQSEYTEKLDPQDAEKNVIFYLQCLSDLANASNSIIGMWALKPSILELLAIKMCPHNETMMKERPALQYAILFLLYSHCKKNNHFIASSDLVTNSQQRNNDLFGLSNLSLGEVSGASPTSGHLAVILETLSIVLGEHAPRETLLLVLNWISDIFFQLDKYLPMVSMSKTFLVLVTNMLSIAYCFDSQVIILVIKNCQHLLKNKSFTWNVVVLKNITVLCILNMDNQNWLLAKLCKEVLFELPWDIVQQEFDKQTIKAVTCRKASLTALNTDSKLNALKEYFTRGSLETLSDYNFKMIVNNLLQLTTNDKSFALDAFLSSWPLQNPEIVDNHLSFFRQCAMNFSSHCISWALSELANACVVQKLKTPLGKPQDTFMKIEGALKEIARETTSLETKYTATEKLKLLDVVTGEQKRSRWLIEFMMFLEKYTYNAREGTATALPLGPTKLIKGFYRTNRSTCEEWLMRVRPAALADSLYSGHLGAVVYHASLILQNAANSKTNIDIEAITISVARALIKLQEPEVLHGLYVWIKQTFNLKFHWLKGAAEQANSRHEIAIGYYKKLNNSTNNNESEKATISRDMLRVRKFIHEQIMESYKHIQNWEEMQEWKENDLEWKQASQWDSFSALKLYEENTDFSELLGNWDILDIESGEIPKNTCSCQGLLNKVESTMVSAALNLYYNDYDEKYNSILNDCEILLNSSAEELTRTNTVHYLKDIAVLQLANHGLKNIVKNGKLILNPFKATAVKENKYGTDIKNLSRLLWWNQYFTKLNMTEENIFFTECLRLDVIKSARKSANIVMAKQELLKHFKQNSAFQMCLANVNDLDDLSNVLLMSSNTYDLDIWTLNNATALAELCKVTYAKEDSKTHAINLCASISLGFSQRLAMGEQSYELRERGTRMLLTLSKWVQNENEIVLDNESPLIKLISALPEIGLVDNNISENVIPLSDSAVGKLLQFGVNQCPGLAKAWANFGAWCFRWGRKMVEFSSKTREQLTDNDKLQIESVMIGCSPQDFEAVCEILSKTKATCDDEDIDWNEINTSEMIENQLRTVPSLNNAYPEDLALLVDIWRQAQKRVFSYFELSADAYFKFLQLICASDYINHSGENAVVNATLRLLRLIVKHAMELQTVLESGLANTPTQPWKVIIPQLFSRLNHPETYVRKCVSDLLCRLAEDTPHLITFPAVVGAVENEENGLTELGVARSFLSNDEAEIDENNLDLEDAASDKMVNNELNSCFLDMVETLAKQAPKTIQQVKLLVKELQRINLLWDELCLGTLVQHHSEFSKRLMQLEAEIVKVKNNANLSTEDKEKLIKEKHRIIFDPVVFVLEQLYQITSAKPETPHETAFQHKFQHLIMDVIDKLKNPANPEKPQESWAPLKQLQIKLQQKVNKRTSYILKMSDISPILAEMNDTVITMPGLHTNQRTIRITIKSVENNVAILPTKTRPKKLIFYGSDGKAYTYLFKGLEDLHLDERIMQLLSITNTMLARDSEHNDNQTYRARHYSVIPLGPRSGLISWVDNVTPLFALYKRWQNREAAFVSSKLNKPVNIPRPSELFYNKLTPLLKEAGISTENRKEWPVSILKQVLEELTAETPRDLLWRELWCSSVSPEQWWQMTRRYSYSVAVMSAIGFIIGLGDRHLDNVLVDLTSGEVVHIDYNVCFEKGKTLRVPEKVPFRMTPNLVTALGVTGVEGIFRLACEHVIRTMRRGRETLLTLLEAFVYDPLVEWGGARRRRGGRQLWAARAMLAVRVKELKHAAAENTDQLLAILPEVKQCAENWLKENEELKSLESKLQICHQQMALIKEIEAYGTNFSNHPLYAISQKYTSYKQAKNAVEDSMKALIKILNDFDTQIESFATTSEVLNGPQLMAWVQEFSGPSEDDEKPIFEHIKDFLINAGQSSMISQCEQAEVELNQSMQQTNMLVRSCLELLSQYVAVSQYYPQSQTEYHRIVTFRKYLAAALESKSPEVCREVSNQVTALVNAESNNMDAQQIIAYNYRLQQINSEATVHLNKCLERLQLEGGPEALVIAQEAYREAKANINNWLRNDENAANVLEIVVIGMLCNLNRRFLMLETGAQSAGDCLVDLTSMEGEWFLDDMSALSIQAVELLSLLPLQSAGDDSIPMSVECVRISNLLLADLVQLNYNFSAIILPEALKKLHSEEPSALMMINELNAVIMNSPVPLNDLLAQLEMHFRYLLMDMESPASGSQVLAAELRARYEALLSAREGEGERAGRMLLMGFNGLFAAVELRARELADHLAAPVPPAWRKIDHISDAMRMSAAAMASPVLRAVLEDIFLVRRVQTVAEALAQCAPLSAPLDDAALCKPVRRFTAEYVSRCVLGVQSAALARALCLLLHARIDLHAEVEQKEIGASWSVSLESLCEKALSLAAPGARAAARASALAGAAQAAAARAHRAAAAARHADRARAAARAARLRHAAHAQLHAEVLNSNQDPSPALARRSKELKAAVERLSAATTKAQTFLNSAHQRVKWGAGANPALRGTLRQLEGAWGARAARARALAAAAAALAAHARTAAARTPPHAARAARAPRTVRTALAHWEKACTLSQKYSLEVSPVEESLMEMLHPEGSIDAQWVGAVSALVRDAAGAASTAARGAAARLAAPRAARHAALADLRAPLLALHAVNDRGAAARLAAPRAARHAALADLRAPLLALHAVNDRGAAARLAAPRAARHAALADLRAPLLALHAVNDVSVPPLPLYTARGGRAPGRPARRPPRRARGPARAAAGAARRQRRQCPPPPPVHSAGRPRAWPPRAPPATPRSRTCARRCWRCTPSTTSVSPPSPCTQRGAAARLAAPRAARHAALADLRAPLLALHAVNDGNNPAQEFSNRWQAASEQLAAVTAEPGSEAGVAAAVRAADLLLQELPALLQMLLDLPNKWSETSTRKLTRQAAVTSAKPTSGKHSGASGGASGGAGGARQGAGVWKRVRLKLEGRPLPAEQVEQIIAEATSADNLCMMYEGWMAWV
ncbi:serine/threonine-protein kinase SMG1 [Epargyreus clarus]|uniref:serine/threonine-protein kinase SMG1 n=1 Tax=Epargyreus clarus TaxID=520877 RepID=UPI003C2D0211